MEQSKCGRRRVACRGRACVCSSRLASSGGALIEGLRKAGAKRVVYVGGACSLEVAPGTALADTPDFPEPYRAEAREGREALSIRGTELDSWSGRTFVSLVSFLFDRTRVLGLPVPFHRRFEEVNLRFYVRRTARGEIRRAVTFIKELVPRVLVARVARLAYNEPHTAVSMRHHYANVDETGARAVVEYGWRVGADWRGMRVTPTGPGSVAAPGSEEEFITEHYWGYTRQRDGSTIEYRVIHPKWRVWAADSAEVTGDLAAVYGPTFAATLASRPSSAFLADGSPVVVERPVQLVGGA